ncbi:hypothetical protein GCM10007920_07320 [Ciceribacter naphthalenivorans]|uniref:Sulfatase N-terminal domain-containing protein n=2 Tax=Alphaproteobacteria TaxID=28211 RepID=A0A512HIN6_9HYPH|nr:sulfatase-like hydrolase/transferase [Sphingomonas psychrolutea]GEO85308.1 hypothetical protein RNA01_22400 [Ciceribacter naphthalenivorans]GLR20947.1 hypothetical protein GCM10007920_07320 [Ciceribacter naphthalenivorans]GLT03803.1 hypothetical protein GCM10007926_07320 [Sphingomonas psychrolutea]
MHATSEIGAAPAYSKDETQTAFLTDAFLAWREMQDRSWFAHVSFLRPHPPFCVPEPYNRMFAAGSVARLTRAVRREAETSIHPFAHFAIAAQVQSSFIYGAQGGIDALTAEDFVRIRAVYSGMIAEVDAQFGRIVSVLRDSGQWQSTIVIFTSDHAEMMGDHWALGKGGYHKGSYHIPLVIRDPATASVAGRQVEVFTSAADIMPTLCEQLGLLARNHQDGQPLMPFIAGDEPRHW